MKQITGQFGIFPGGTFIPGVSLFSEMSRGYFYSRGYAYSADESNSIHMNHEDFTGLFHHYKPENLDDYLHEVIVRKRKQLSMAEN